MRCCRHWLACARRPQARVWNWGGHRRTLLPFVTRYTQGSRGQRAGVRCCTHLSGRAVIHTERGRCTCNERARVPRGTCDNMGRTQACVRPRAGRAARTVEKVLCISLLRCIINGLVGLT
ncbi:hypothetical protein C8Q80DRAFT_1208517 [Daedaleopsis nitida]|nr:hypothetical protein C8Q80DRAFT_1208517 [Daedaleopsis nitida]